MFNIRKKIVFIMFFTFVVTTSSFSIAKEELQCDSYEDKVLTQEQLDEVLAICDAEIEKDKAILAEKEGETSGVEQEIENLNRKIKISENYINEKNIQLDRLKKDIGENRADIKNLSADIETLKKSLKNMMYKKYQYQDYTTIETIFSQKTISEFFQTMELVEFLEKKISKEVGKITDKKQDLEILVGELEERDALEKELIEQKKVEANKIQQNKQYQNELLGILKKEVGEQKNVIADKDEIRQAILRKKYTVASGEKVTFGEAYGIISPYEKVLGMDAAFVLAILFQESGWNGQIGGNIGQCTYDQKNSHGTASGGYTVMRNSQKSNFEQIMADLGINPSKQKVSCPIPSDGSYGGAMGPAQFMPNTWMGIRSQAAKIIGKEPEDMSPFVNHDAFIASATYLKNNYYSSSCTNYVNQYKHIQSERTLRERCAAAMYYAGGNWFKYRMTYGESVVQRANKFRADIKTLKE